MSHTKRFFQSKHLALVLPVAVALTFLLAPLPVEVVREGLNEVAETTPQQAPLHPMPDLDLEAPLPDFARIEDVAARKQAFFDFLLPRIQYANSELLKARSSIVALRERSLYQPLTIDEGLWLALLASHYRVPMESGFDDDFFARLLRHVDVIPPSLVLAQAANESGWGRSRFAREGNNLFGEYCYRPGCGLVPRQRPEGASFEVARFSSPYQSLLSYMTNLNRHDRYHLLRHYREQARQRGELISGRQLAQGLHHYSERGEDYISDLRSFIRHNKLERLDQPLIASHMDQPSSLTQQAQEILP